MIRPETTVKLQALLWILFFAAIALNTIDVFTHPSARWWQALRFVVSALFTIVLVGVLVAKLGEWRGRRNRNTGPSS